MRRGLCLVFSVAVLAVGCRTSSAPQPGPDDHVLSVLGMHWGSSCETRVRAAVRSLPFVEPDSVRASVSSRRVLFQLKKDHTFDLAGARKALVDAGYGKVEVVSEPKG